MIREFGRLLFFVLVILPLSLLLIGPLLMLSALRGRQQVGPITLNPGRRGVGGRARAFLLGLFVLLLVWGGLALAFSQLRLPTIHALSSGMLQADNTPTVPAVIVMATATPLPTFTPQPTVTYTPTERPTEEVPTSLPSPPPSPIPPTSTPVLSTATSTLVPPSPTIPPTPTPSLTLTPPPAATFTPPSTPIATLSPKQISEALATVETANELLRVAVVEPSIGNLAALETFWQGESLAKAQAFAQDLYQRYLGPLEVDLTYILPPRVVGQGSPPGTAFVFSVEQWSYTGSRSSHSETFDFAYTLNWRDEGWVITDYAYGYASNAVPSEGENTQTPVPTPVDATPTGQ